jgi:prepilin-type N-terminal cleavage/methylation domain-containing protein
MMYLRKRKGFSLLELLAVVTILGVIAAIIIARFTTTTTTAKNKLNVHNKAVINAMVERYYMESNAWPAAALTELDDPNYFPDGIPVSPFDNTTQYTIDNTTHRVNNIPNQ